MNKMPRKLSRCMHEWLVGDVKVAHGKECTKQFDLAVKHLRKKEGKKWLRTN